MVVRDGAVVPGDPVVLATIDFLANGGDCYFNRGIPQAGGRSLTNPNLILIGWVLELPPG